MILGVAMFIASVMSFAFAVIVGLTKMPMLFVVLVKTSWAYLTAKPVVKLEPIDTETLMTSINEANKLKVQETNVLGETTTTELKVPGFEDINEVGPLTKEETALLWETTEPYGSLDRVDPLTTKEEDILWETKTEGDKK